MPEMMVWPSPRRSCTRKVGSSFGQLVQGDAQLLLVGLGFGSTATEITGSGNSMRSRMMGCFPCRRGVAGGDVLQPTAAQSRPPKTSLISCACWRASSGDGRSAHACPGSDSAPGPPEEGAGIDRKKVRAADEGSVMILKASAAKGASSSGTGLAGSPSSSHPRWRTSTGLGR